jgi:HEAT repeat protein
MRQMFRGLLLSVGLTAVAQAQDELAVRQFIQSLNQMTDTGIPPDQEASLRALEQVNGLTREAVARLFPSVIVALNHRNGDVAMQALMVLFAVGQRSDGAILLRPLIDDIARLLENKSDPRVPRLAGVILATMHPSPPPEIISPIVAFIQKKDQDLENRVIISELLMDHTSNHPEATAAFDALLAENLTPKMRIIFLDAIGRRVNPDEHLRAIVLKSLRDEDSGVRHRALYHVSRMGPETLVRASVDLQRMAVDPSETSENRASARKVLRGDRGDP